MFIKRYRFAIYYNLKTWIMHKPDCALVPPASEQDTHLQKNYLGLKLGLQS